MKNDIACPPGCTGAGYSDCRDIGNAVSLGSKSNICYSRDTTNFTEFNVSFVSCYFYEVGFRAGPPNFIQPLTGSIFDGCSMVGAEFTGNSSQLNDVKFKNTCDLTKASFVGKDLSSTTFDSTTIFNNTDFTSCTLDISNFANSFGSNNSVLYDNITYNDYDKFKLAYTYDNPIKTSTLQDGLKYSYITIKTDTTEGTTFSNITFNNCTFLPWDKTTSSGPFPAYTFNNTTFKNCTIQAPDTFIISWGFYTYDTCIFTNTKFTIGPGSDYKYPLSNIKFIGCTGLENSFDPQLNCFLVFNSDSECPNLKTLNQKCQSCLFSSNGIGLPPKKFKYLLILLLFHLLRLFNRLRRWLSN